MQPSMPTASRWRSPSPAVATGPSPNLVFVYSSVCPLPLPSLSPRVCLPFPSPPFPSRCLRLCRLSVPLLPILHPIRPASSFVLLCLLPLCVPPPPLPCPSLLLLPLSRRAVREQTGRGSVEFPCRALLSGASRVHCVVSFADRVCAGITGNPPPPPPPAHAHARVPSPKFARGGAGWRTS